MKKLNPYCKGISIKHGPSSKRASLSVPLFSRPHMPIEFADGVAMDIIGKHIENGVQWYHHICDHEKDEVTEGETVCRSTVHVHPLAFRIRFVLAWSGIG
jgi:hypothetical protein